PPVESTTCGPGHVEPWGNAAGGGGRTQSFVNAAPVVAESPVHWRVKYVTPVPGDAWSSVYAIVAAPFVGSSATWKKSSSVRSRAGVDVSQARPSMQIEPVWMTLSEACA